MSFAETYLINETYSDASLEQQNESHSIRLANLSRRSLLKSIGISTASLVVGVQFSGLASASTKTSAENFSPDVFVSIDTTGLVTIISHRSEMGQGVRSTLPLLVADEMEADWERVKVEQALGDAKYGSQNTDGSRSVRKNYVKLKQAGAIMKDMLARAAAKQWNVDVKQVSLKKHKAKLNNSNKTLDFAELVETARDLPLPERDKLVLKKESEQTYIGKENIPLLDGKLIHTGKAIYGTDVQLDGMKIAVIARPPVVFGTVKSYDAKETLKVPGVLKVIELPALKPPASFKMLGGLAVIAEHSYAAIKGRKKLKIKWDLGKNSQHSTKAHEEVFRKALEKPSQVVRERGEFQKSFSATKNKLEAEYYVPGLVHATMEPPAATARLTENGVEVWASTQTPQAAQNIARAVMELPEDKIDEVKINVTLLGGGFGRKSKPDFVAEAVFLAKETKWPVKVLWTREDEMQHGYYHSPSLQKLSGSIDENGKVNSWRHSMVNHPIASTFNPAAKVAGSADLGQGDVMFDIPNMLIDLGETETYYRIGWLRSVTNINNAFAACSFADELAHAAKKDPKDFLLDMIGKDQHIDFSKDKYNYPNYGEPLSDYPADTARLKEVIRVAADKAKWGRKLPEGWGMGIAAHRSFNTYVATIVVVSIKDGTLKLEEVHNAVDAGKVLNPDRVRSQMEGAAIFSASLAYYGEITAKDGAIEQSNFDDYPLTRMADFPELHTYIIESDAIPTGVGEPGVPPFTPALCNAIFAASGKRYRRLPLRQYGLV